MTNLSDFHDFLVGAVLVTPDGNYFYTSCRVPDAVVRQWIPKKQMIGQIELFAGPLALATWANMLTDQPLLHFIDNDSALAALVKGYSPKRDSSRIVGDFWLLAAKFKLFVYLDRVESKSNVADGPSREDLSLTRQLIATFSQPSLDVFAARGHIDDPLSWFAAA
eukprot:2185739-Heterocapsa_arctica.AAC.1